MFVQSLRRPLILIVLSIALTSCEKDGPFTDLTSLFEQAAADVSVTTNEDSSVVIEIDSGELGNALTPQFEIVSQPKFGKATILTETPATRVKVKYIPDHDKNGADEFTFQWLSGGLHSNLGKVVINVTPIPDAPVAQNGNLNTDEDQPVRGILFATDADGDSLTFSVVTAPTKGVVQLLDATKGTYLFSPNADEVGMDSFTFKANDGSLDSEVKTITVNLENVNDAPTVEPIEEITIRHRDAFTFGVVASDADGDETQVQLINEPNIGSVHLDGNYFHYFPDWRKTDAVAKFTFNVTDGTAESELQTVTIRMLPSLDGKWIMAVSQLFDLDDYSALPFNCDQYELQMLHSKERLVLPSYEIVCYRGEEKRTFSRPGMDLQITERENGYHTLHTLDNAPFVASGGFGNIGYTYMYVYYPWGAVNKSRWLSHISDKYSQELYNGWNKANGVLFYETLDNYDYRGSLRRLTP